MVNRKHTPNNIATTPCKPQPSRNNWNYIEQGCIYTLAGQGSDKEEGMYKFYTDEPVYLASGIVMEIFCHVK